MMQQTPMANQMLQVTAEDQGKTLAAFLRPHLPGKSWSEIRRLVESRRIRVGKDPCFDPARRLKTGEVVEVLEKPTPKPIEKDAIVIRHLDEHVVVVEKPSGISTVRHPSERDWLERRRALSPTLEDLVKKRIEAQARGEKVFSHLRIVHRLDKETSGLLVFARTVLAESKLGKQFHAHSVHRRYLALIPGHLPSQRIESYLVRDRGDGRRGSSRILGQGKKAITHIEVVERIAKYTLLSCRLETGRTHQIRIHLAEAGHPICGEAVYNRPFRAEPLPDESGAPRLALHATELGFQHPATCFSLFYQMPLPADLTQLLENLREK